MVAVFRGRRGLIVAFLSLLILISSTMSLISFTTKSAGGDVLYVPKTQVMSNFLKQTNELRLSYGLDPLIADKSLEESANAKLVDMKAKEYWGHYGPNNAAFSDIIWDKKPNANKVGENLARCFANHQTAFKGLKNSPTHFEVMVSEDFSLLGVASMKTKNGCESIVMHFAS